MIHGLRHALNRLLRRPTLPDCCSRYCPACQQDTLDPAVLTCWAEERPGVTLYGGDLPIEEYGPEFDPHADLPARCRVCRVAFEQRIGCGCDDDGADGW